MLKSLIFWALLNAVDNAFVLLIEFEIQVSGIAGSAIKLPLKSLRKLDKSNVVWWVNKTFRSPSGLMMLRFRSPLCYVNLILLI